MTSTTSNPGRAVIGVIGLACMLAATPCGAAQATEHYPDIRLTYADLALDTPAGRRALVERVENTATRHCVLHGPLILPRHRRAQSGFCAHAVRGDILRALPRPVRAAYDEGRRQGPVNRP